MSGFLTPYILDFQSSHPSGGATQDAPAPQRSIISIPAPAVRSNSQSHSSAIRPSAWVSAPRCFNPRPAVRRNVSESQNRNILFPMADGTKYTQHPFCSSTETLGERQTLLLWLRPGPAFHSVCTASWQKTMSSRVSICGGRLSSCHSVSALSSERYCKARWRTLSQLRCCTNFSTATASSSVSVRNWKIIFIVTLSILASP